MDRKLKVLIIFVVLFLIQDVFMAIYTSAQDILLLERPGTIKNIKYYNGDNIRLGIFGGDSIISGEITRINDSGFIINTQFEVQLNQICTVYKLRKFFRFSEELFFKAGIPYIILTATNRTINNEYPILDKEVALISGSLVLAGMGSALIKYRKCRIDNTRWRLIILKR